MSMLEELTEQIQSLPDDLHIDILKIIRTQNEPNINISENNNGCFINMNELNNNTIEQIKKFIDFNNKNINEMKSYENQKNIIYENLINNQN